MITVATRNARRGRKNKRSSSDLGTDRGHVLHVPVPKQARDLCNVVALLSRRVISGEVLAGIEVPGRGNCTQRYAVTTRLISALRWAAV